jgi:hypothetical protein
MTFPLIIRRIARMIKIHKMKYLENALLLYLQTGLEIRKNKKGAAK